MSFLKVSLIEFKKKGFTMPIIIHTLIADTFLAAHRLQLVCKGGGRERVREKEGEHVQECWGCVSAAAVAAAADANSDWM